MGTQYKMLALAFKDKFERSNMSLEEYLKSIPNSVNYKARTDEPGVSSIQVIFSPLNIVQVESNGTDFLVTGLT